MLRVVAALGLLAFTVYTAVDCIQSDQDRVRNLPKIAWVVLVLLFTPAGGIAWWIAGRPRVPPPAIGLGRWGGRGGPTPFPKGPDDDPDFLRKL